MTRHRIAHSYQARIATAIPDDILYHKVLANDPSLPHFILWAAGSATTTIGPYQPAMLIPRNVRPDSGVFTRKRRGITILARSASRDGDSGVTAMAYGAPAHLPADGFTRGRADDTTTRSCRRATARIAPRRERRRQQTGRRVPAEPLPRFRRSRGRRSRGQNQQSHPDHPKNGHRPEHNKAETGRCRDCGSDPPGLTLDELGACHPGE